jgi:hypothetical protein
MVRSRSLRPTAYSSTSKPLRFLSSGPNSRAASGEATAQWSSIPLAEKGSTRWATASLRVRTTSGIRSISLRERSMRGRCQ